MAGLERDRLQADLRALDATPLPPFNLEPLAMQDIDPESPLRTELPAVADIDPEPPALDPAPEPSAAVFCFPARSESARASAVSPEAGRLIPTASQPAPQRVVSPKVAQLMLAPRRPALERSGIARVGGRADRADRSPEEMVEEVDPQAELYERSM